MNLLLPLLLFAIAFMVPYNLVIGQVLVHEVAIDSPAAMTGIEAGDILLRVNGKPVHNTGDLHRYIQLNLGKEITLLVKHPDSTTENIQLIPRWKPPEGQGAIGIAVSTSNPTIVRQHYSPWKSIYLGAKECIETLVLFKNGIVTMIIGTAPVQIAGPVGIVQVTGEIARAGWSALLEFAAFLSINLGILNLFPLPALDGGRIVFVLLEWVRRGKRISPKKEGLIHLIGFAMLISAMLLLTYQDIIRIINGGSLLP